MWYRFKREFGVKWKKREEMSMMTRDELINEIKSLAYEISTPIDDLKYMTYEELSNLLSELKEIKRAHEYSCMSISQRAEQARVIMENNRQNEEMEEELE